MNEALEKSAGFVVDPHHPALEGHFLGNPLLPGVVLLDHVICVAEGWLGKDWRVGGLPQVKFVSPLRPGDQADVRLVRREERVHFTVTCRGTMVAQGILTRAAEVASP